jgi:hypothetical protein
MFQGVVAWLLYDVQVHAHRHARGVQAAGSRHVPIVFSYGGVRVVSWRSSEI